MNPSSVEADVERLRELVKAQRFADALGAAEGLLARVPENRDVLYLRAVSQRLSGDIEGALATLERLERLHPRFSGLFQERGHCHVARRRAPEAVDAFLRGVRINPALMASWSLLERLYRMTGQAENAATAAAHVAKLRSLPPEVVTATALFADEEWAQAETLIRAFLLRHGHHIEAMRLLARIGVQQGALDDAQRLYEGLLELAPDYHTARFEYAQVLVDRHLYGPAHEQAQTLVSADPANRAYRTLHAMTCVGLGRHDEAIQIYQGLLPGAAQPAQLHLSIAHSLKTLGQREEAIAEYRAAVEVHPGYGEAYWSLANLKTYRFTAAELERMRGLEDSPGLSATDRAHLGFALGKALEDARDYAGSFEQYARGNALRKAEGHYRPEAVELNTRLQIQFCTPELFARHKNSGAPDPDPIFVLGLPRSGSTLVEQILASHPAVEGTQELADVPRIVAELQGRDVDTLHPRYPRVLTEMSDEDFKRLGGRYLADTRAYRTDRPRFIDKMPNNFRHVGLIHLMLPRATIIDVRREPMACCFGLFKQLFAKGQDFAYGIDDVARYYRTYLELMRHWDTVLPGRVLRVHYEDLVEDLEGNVRRMLAHCGLPFEPACIEFHKTERSVRTASSEQVRQPLYREGLEQWRHYEPWLGPLSDALGDARTRYRE